MNSKLALMPLLIMSAFSYAADEATPETPVQQQLQEVNVRADAKRVKAARSYSIASDGDLRDRVNLGVLGKANAFTAPITVVNYDEQALNNTEARTLVDAVAKKDASVWQFGGESNTLTGLLFPRLTNLMRANSASTVWQVCTAHKVRPACKSAPRN